MVVQSRYYSRTSLEELRKIMKIQPTLEPSAERYRQAHPLSSEYCGFVNNGTQFMADYESLVVVKSKIRR
jgi:hypothetical protein